MTEELWKVVLTNLFYTFIAMFLILFIIIFIVGVVYFIGIIKEVIKLWEE